MPQTHGDFLTRISMSESFDLIRDMSLFRRSLEKPSILIKSGRQRVYVRTVSFSVIE
jgi:hypothetical protein